MEGLPEEILIDVLDYLDPDDLISAQKACSALSKSARANPLWRYKCFEKSPSASIRNTNGIWSTLSTALQGPPVVERPVAPQTRDSATSIRESRRARAVNKWDLSAKEERVDWYSEYKGRYAPLSIDWLVDSPSGHVEVKGIATLNESNHAVGYLEDASICLWDISESVSGRRKIRELGRSKSSVLFADTLKPPETLVVDCVSALSSQQKAFIAIGNVLNEVDLNTLRVVSQSKYAFPITALSQQTATDLPLTIGTQFTLHILDPRIPVTPASQSHHERIEEVPAISGRSTAILPDLSEHSDLLPSTFGASAPFSADHGPSIRAPGSPNWRPSHRLRSPHWMAYARVEPGPLSILHHAENEILLGGRFPSILSYDRRYFPRLQYAIHSGASLSALASIPHSPAGASSGVRGTSTLVACGEYRGRGSLEIYSLPHVKSAQIRRSQDATLNNTPPEVDNMDASSPRRPSADETLYSYKNRQEAAKSKLLSVASHGTKLVFSDSEGGLKWVERDGRSLVRRWNINSFQVGQEGGSVSGDQVARKIMPLGTPESERGRRGDSDLLVWTGEKMGIVTTNPQFADHEELVRELEEDGNAREEREKAEEYSKAMRRALERQADERRWMSHFRLKRRDF